MSPERAIHALAELVAREPTADLVLAAWLRPVENFVLRRLELSERLANHFVRIASAAVDNLSSRRLRVFDVGYRLDDDEAAVLDLKENPELAAIVADLAAPGNLDRLNDNLDVVRNLKFYSTTIRQNDTRALFVRSYGKSKVLSQSRLFGAFFTGDVYDRIDDSALLFDEGVDLIVKDSVAFILNDAQFRRIFRIAEVLREQTAAAVAEMNQRFPIANQAEFLQACQGQVQMMAKAIAIPGKPYFRTLTMADVRRVIADFNLPLEIRNIDGQDRLVFDASLERRWLILKVLDDDYLESTMTQLHYEVNSKVELR